MHRESQECSIEQELGFGSKLHSRAQIPPEYTWDLASVFPSVEAWESESLRLKGCVERFKTFEGTLAQLSPLDLYNFLDWSDQTSAAAGRVMVYASLDHAGDTRVAAPIERRAKAQALGSELRSAHAFVDPELVSIGEAGIAERCAACPALRLYERRFRELFRMRPHIRSAEVEGVIAQAGQVLRGAENAYGALSSADLEFASVATPSGARQVTQGNIDTLLADPEREVRRQVWESYYDGYRRVDDTVAALYQGAVEGSVFTARVRNFPSSLREALFRDNLPETVYRQVLEVSRAHHGIWQRYFRARAVALKVQELREYDLQAPLSAKPPVIPYREGVQLILDGLAPLGAEYLERVRRGVTAERWVDVFPNAGKEGNAYSSGAYGTRPFTLWNYGNSMTDVSTGAHELGHSAHTLLASEQQPYPYAGYGMMVAETASNCNQAIIREGLLEKGDDNFKLAVLDETFHNLHRYLFVMPLLARFELQCHEWVERGEGLGAERLKNLMNELLEEAYGGAVTIEPARSGLFWAPFSHLYAPFYVFNYAAGIAAANAIAADILAEKPGARERYLGMLKMGSSVDQLDALRHAGVDLSTAAPLERAFEIVERHISRLESISARR